MDQTNLDIYGSEPIPWSRALEQLEAGAAKSCWLATTRPDARPRPYSAPSAGPPPWDLYVVTPVTAFGVATAEPYGATRWRFG
jgi:hypothetical protein